MVNVVVPLLPLRAALKAVEAHSSGSVVLAPGGDLVVSASDGFGAAVAVVPILDREDGEADLVEVALPDVAATLAVFKPPRNKRWAAQAVVRLRLDRPDPGPGEPSGDDEESAGEPDAPAPFGDLVIAPADGLFAMRELRFPVGAPASPVDVRAVVAGFLRGDDHEGDVDFGVAPSSLAALRVASSAFAAPPFLRLVEGMLSPVVVATVGPDFVGIYATSRPVGFDSDLPEPTGHRSGWSARLAGLTVSDEVEAFLEESAERFEAALRKLLGEDADADEDEDGAGEEDGGPIVGQEELDLDTLTDEDEDEDEGPEEVGGWPITPPRR